MTKYKELGLLRRFNYERTDGKSLDPDEELYTLRFDKDDPWGDACRETLRDFSARIETLGYNTLAADLRERIEGIELRIAEERKLAKPPSTPTPLPQL